MLYSLSLKIRHINGFVNEFIILYIKLCDLLNVTKKNIIWVNPFDLMAILKPERTKLVQYLRKKRRVFFSELMSEMQRTPVSLNNDLKILSKYQLVKILKEPNPGHGVRKVIESTFDNEKIEFKAEI